MNPIDKELFYKAALDLPIGGMPLRSQSTHYAIYRYDDCWWALWNIPKEKYLGFELPTDRDLANFIFGRPSAKFKAIQVEME